MAKIFPESIPVSDYPLIIPDVEFPSNFDNVYPLAEEIERITNLIKLENSIEGDKRAFINYIRMKFLKVSNLTDVQKKADPNANICLNNLQAFFEVHLTDIQDRLDETIIQSLAFEVAKVLWWINDYLPDSITE